ncbi:UNVERIFIED_CONTAM: hypothetical protein Slati_4480900 [Sesamum latifolium]|uniref:Uncharacterized protein n=1 Tax=Sesamum latifolium TaxID=2727402 RepID=A0AAW2SRS5_9LAMI
MVGLIYEAIGMGHMHADIENDTQSTENDYVSGADEKTLKFYQLLEDANRELCPGCTDFTKLSFSVHLLNLKVSSGWTNKSFSLLLGLLKKAFPKDVNLPKDFDEANKITKNLGFTYETWDPRLQKLFMSSETAPLMGWHAEGRVDDGKFRHPADSLAWKDFDEKNIAFSSECQNVRLGLAVDGFSPFKMNECNFLLSVLIDGLRGPGNKIDVYLQPLIEELKNYGIMVLKLMISRKEMFVLKATLMWTISDLPSYTMLSGLGTKTDKGCPCCGMETMCRRLEIARKYSYTYHRRFLSRSHRLRRDTISFDGKTKDNLHAHRELAKLGVRKPLHAFKRPSGTWCLPSGPCNMALHEKDVFCKVLKSIRALDGYTSNISKCVQVEKRTLWGLKSHDNHVLMQNLLPIAVRKALPKHVVDVLIELSTFFRKLFESE